MKKIYKKPMVLIENFSLSTNIAGDCDTKTNTPSQNQCAYPLRSGHMVFMSEIAACTTTEDDGEYEGICYHVPNDAKNLFNS